MMNKVVSHTRVDLDSSAITNAVSTVSFGNIGDNSESRLLLEAEVLIQHPASRIPAAAWESKQV